MTTNLLTRDQLGMRAPTGPYTPLAAEGITLHYGGPSPWGSFTWNTVDEWLAHVDRRRCASIWRAWQDFHMTPGALGTTPPNHPIDVAYTSGVTPWGERFEGRGPGHRTAAQGTDEGNRRSYAVVYLAGGTDPLTDAAKLAFLDEQDRLGQPIRWVHHDWHSTSCPGGPIDAWKQAGCQRPGGVVIPPAPPLTLPPQIARSATYETEDGMRFQVIEYPIPALENGDGYWDLDGAPGRPLVPAGRCVSVMVNGADQPGPQAGEARPLKYGSFTRVRLFGFEHGAKPTLIVSALLDS